MEAIIADLSKKFLRYEREARRLTRVIEEGRAGAGWPGVADKGFAGTMERQRDKAIKAAQDYALAIEALRAVRIPVIVKV